MKVKDFAAELMSEIADEAGYVVYKYECNAPSNGSIVFELEEELEDEDDAHQYKLLTYIDHEVRLNSPSGYRKIDLHEPKSVDDIRAWFEDSEDSYNSPLGFDFTSTTTTFTTAPFVQQTPGYNPWGLTTNPYGTGTAPYTNGGITIDTGVTYTPCNTITYSTTSNHSIFSVDPNFGSLTLGPV